MGGTLSYMQTIIGKNFNRKKLSTGMYGEQLSPTDPEYKSVLTLPEGAGLYTQRKWFSTS
jgi:hypothetical protein